MGMRGYTRVCAGVFGCMQVYMDVWVWEVRQHVWFCFGVCTNVSGCAGVNVFYV